MRKFILALSLILGVSTAQATHLFRNSASNINTGTLDSDRLPIIPASKLDMPDVVLAVTANLGKPYSLVVGTAGAVGVDMRVTSLADFNAALSTLGANGLTLSATGYGTILFKSGVYDLSGATVPAGVKLVALDGSSVVWRVTDGSKNLVKIYGKVDGFKFDASGQGIATRLIDVASNGQLTNFDLYGASQNPTNGGLYRFSTISVRNSSNVVIQGTMRDFYFNQDVSNEGENSYIKVYDSTGVTLTLNAYPNSGYYGGVFGTNNIFNFIHTVRSHNVRVSNGDYKDFGATILRIGSKSSDIFFERNRVEITTWVPAGNYGDGLISFENRTEANGPYTSTGTISISYNNISISTGNSTNGGTIAGNFVWAGANGANALVNGVIIRGNTMTFNRAAFSNSPSLLINMRLATIAAASRGTVIQDNYDEVGTVLISDSGTATLYTGLGNIFKGVEQ